MSEPLVDDFMVELRERFPTYAPIFGMFPEIDEILKWAITDLDENNVSEFSVRLEESEFWKSRSAEKRNWDLESARDPGTAKRRREQRQATIRRRAQAYGISLTDDQITSIAETSLGWSFSDQELNDAILANDSATSTGVGTLSATADDIMVLARDYLLQVPPAEARRLAAEIEKGTVTVDGITNQFRREAGASFPQFEEALGAGLTLRDATSSIRAHVSNTLGMPESMIDFNNDRWTDLIDHVDESGQRRMMTRAEAGRWARKQAEYTKTDEARQVATGIVNSVSQMMGKKK